MTNKNYENKKRRKEAEKKQEGLPFKTQVGSFPAPLLPAAPLQQPPPQGINLQITAEELKKQKLFLAVPMYGGMCAGVFSKSVMDLSALCTHYGLPLQAYFLFNESLITRARNYCCDEFMRSDATHLMFIDSDIGFNPNDVIALLGLTMQNPDMYHIIGGPYPKKCISWEKIKLAVDKGFADKNPNDLEKFVGDYVFNPKGGQTEIPIATPAEVLELGTGFMMVPKNTFKVFEEKMPQYLYRPDHVRTAHFDGSRQIMQYFQAEIDNYDVGLHFADSLEQIKSMQGEAEIKAFVDQTFQDAMSKLKASSNRYLSEDYWFCQKIQQLGLRAWLCPWMQLAHMGSMIFGGSLADLARIGAAATASVDELRKARAA